MIKLQRGILGEYITVEVVLVVYVINADVH